MFEENIPSLLAFVNEFQLKKTGGVIAFNAQVRLQVHNSMISLLSEIQILTLPSRMAVYIIEPIHEQFKLPEMYTTDDACFNFTRNHMLEISALDKSIRIFISPYQI